MMNRRNFLALCASAPAFSQDAAGGPGLWVDPRLANLPKRPWRKIHLDFHNSQHIPRIGDKFDADEFAKRLVNAAVDSIVVFAKDMHGYFYYPSKYGPVHPGLEEEGTVTVEKALHGPPRFEIGQAWPVLFDIAIPARGGRPGRATAGLTPLARPAVEFPRRPQICATIRPVVV